MTTTTNHDERILAATMEAYKRAALAVDVAIFDARRAPYLLGEGAATAGDWDRADVIEVMERIAAGLRAEGGAFNG